MVIKISDLDKKVAEVLGLEVNFKVSGTDGYHTIFLKRSGKFNFTGEFTPSTNWQQAGELLEEYDLTLQCRTAFSESSGQHKWFAYAAGKYGDGAAPTPQEAICKAVIALKEKEYG